MSSKLRECMHCCKSPCATVREQALTDCAMLCAKAGKDNLCQAALQSALQSAGLAQTIVTTVSGGLSRFVSKRSADGKAGLAGHDLTHSEVAMSVHTLTCVLLVLPEAATQQLDLASPAHASAVR